MKQSQHTPNREQLAENWVTKNPDSEVRRMYGHYKRAFLAGYDANTVNAELLEALKNLVEDCQRHGYVPPSQGNGKRLIEKLTSSAIANASKQ